MTGTRVLAAIAAAMLLVGCGERGVSARRIADADHEPGAWLTTGRTYGEQHYSPLRQIDRDNVARLGLAWQANLGSNDFGVEATPLVADGRLYVTSTWSRVFAFDARTGAKLWSFDPGVKHEWLRQACCKAVNRGVALLGDRVYVGAFDGRLIALDAKSGRPVWVADTTDHRPNYSITGAPRIADGKVIIGNGGADFGARGFVSTYDAQTGRLAWRFFVTPRDPRTPQETPALQAALKTWDPKQDWRVAGGGGPWDGMAYDPKLNLLYLGTGNAGPANGPGDQLYVCSILALDARTGRLVWRYQTTPGDHWDFDAVQNLVLAELPIGGRQRQVLMQASKNGFFYVLDRADGRLLSAQKFVRVNWADHVDLTTGRPVPPSAAGAGPQLTFPSPYGAHNWQPMAYRPGGLVYIPAQDIGWVYGAPGGAWFYRGADGASLAPAESAATQRGFLIAWDPTAGRAVWRAALGAPMNGGVLATGGALVVQGLADGALEFRDADSGRLLRRIEVGAGVSAAPMSYSVDGVQYIAVAVGWNGVAVEPDAPGAPPPFANDGRLLVLKLGGGPVPVDERLPAPPPLMAGPPQPADLAQRGHALYATNCARCHGFAGEPTPMPDLRRMSPATVPAFDRIVLGGLYRDGGMASFADKLAPDDTRAIRAYLIDWASRSRNATATASRQPAAALLPPTASVARPPS